MKAAVTQPKVSVIVPIYRVESYLLQCVDSILSQTMEDIEVILIDEGDRDASFAIMRFLADQDSRVRIIHQRWGGYGPACNAGILAARGEFISIIESDDFIAPDMFERMYNHATSLGVDVVKAPFYLFYDNTPDFHALSSICDYSDTITRSCPSTAFHILDYPHLLSVHASIWSGLYRADFLRCNDIRFIESAGPAGYVDVGFRVRTLLEASSIAWLPEPFYYWRCTNTSSSTNNFSLSTMLDRWDEVYNHLANLGEPVISIVLPYLLKDQYANVQSILSLRPITELEFARIKRLLDQTPPSAVHSSPVLSSRQKQEFEMIRNASTKSEYLRTAQLRPTYRPATPQQLVNLYWHDPDWQAFRSVRRRLKLLFWKEPPGEAPEARSWREAADQCRAISRSIGWELLAPLRLLRRLAMR